MSDPAATRDQYDEALERLDESIAAHIRRGLRDRRPVERAIWRSLVRRVASRFREQVGLVRRRSTA